jgi:hypothetical protein
VPDLSEPRRGTHLLVVGAEGAPSRSTRGGCDGLVAEQLS